MCGYLAYPLPRPGGEVKLERPAGLSIPNRTWPQSPTPTTYFTVNTGCAPENPACQSVVSTLPVMP